MLSQNFSIIVPTARMTEEQILDVTDALGEAGCTDGSICGHAEGFEVLFHRTSASLQEAVSSAVADVEHAGFRVSRIVMEREAVGV
jgi:hypothetical protein